MNTKDDLKHVKRLLVPPDILIVALLLGLMPVFSAQSQPLLEYRDPVLGPRDILDIQVFDEEALSMTVVVSASGDFSFPLLERVQAQGRTASELSRHMEQRLLDERFLRYPSVNVLVQEQKYSSVMLTGAVAKQGPAAIYPDMTLRNFLAEHGGILEAEASATIVLKRPTGETIQIVRESIHTTEKQGYGDLSLTPGDVLLVPYAKYIYVTGAVNAPGGFPMTRTLTLEDALGLAGGRSDAGGQLLMWYRPSEPDGPTVMSISYTEYDTHPRIRKATLSEGDSLYVTQEDFVFVGGEVTRPGSYPWKPGMTLLSAILEAGDRNFVSSSGVTLLRVDENGKQVFTTHSYTRMRKRGNDIPVEPGDIIHVQSNILLDIPFTIRRLNPFSFSLQVAEAALF